jgi:hypothetical protein
MHLIFKKVCLQVSCLAANACFCFNVAFLKGATWFCGLGSFTGKMGLQGLQGSVLQFTNCHQIVHKLQMTAIYEEGPLRQSPLRTWTFMK